MNLLITVLRIRTENIAMPYQYNQNAPQIHQNTAKPIDNRHDMAVMMGQGLLIGMVIFVLMLAVGAHQDSFGDEGKKADQKADQAVKSQPVKSQPISSGASFAQDLKSSRFKSSQDVLSAQFQAIRDNDPLGFWQYLSVDFQAKYRSARAAFADIKHKYPDLYTHSDFRVIDTSIKHSHGKERRIDKVEITNQRGQKTLGFFRFIHDNNASKAIENWRLDHIMLLESNSQAI